MNRDNICCMAQEVSGVEFPIPMDGVKIGMSMEHLERFAHLVAAAEKEACAKVCDELVLEHPGRADLTAKQCAAAIRARGQG